MNCFVRSVEFSTIVYFGLSGYSCFALFFSAGKKDDLLWLESLSLSRTLVLVTKDRPDILLDDLV